MPLPLILRRLALSSPQFVRIAGYNPDGSGRKLLRSSQQKEAMMELYMIRRRGVWTNEQDLEAVTEASLRVGEEMKDQLRWIRSYAVTEDDGRIGSVCFYEASDPDAIREHAQRVGAPADEVQVVRGTAVKRTDPEPVVRV
jgi:hypothetical protein